jgi:hypothetical protein
VEAYFLFPCLGIAILLESETCLQFYGGILEHHTAMPIVVLARTKEVVYTAGESGFIFAWGGSGVNSGSGRGAAAAAAGNSGGGNAAGGGVVGGLPPGGGAAAAGTGGGGNAAGGDVAVGQQPGLFVQDDNATDTDNTQVAGLFVPEDDVAHVPEGWIVESEEELSQTDSYFDMY